MVTNGEHIVTLQGDLDAEEYARARALIRPLLAAQIAIVDLRDVTYIDSRTIMIFFELKKGMRNGAILRLVSGESSMEKLLRISGVDQIAEIYPTLEAARAGSPV